MNLGIRSSDNPWLTHQLPNHGTIPQPPGSVALLAKGDDSYFTVLVKIQLNNTMYLQGVCYNISQESHDVREGPSPNGKDVGET